jgi:hypothetical protein
MAVKASDVRAAVSAPAAAATAEPKATDFESLANATMKVYAKVSRAAKRAAKDGAPQADTLAKSAQALKAILSALMGL